MASVISAKNSDEVKSIIESVALSAGSSRVKRESKFNVSVYLGFFVGHEWIKNVENERIINNYSLSALIGASFSWGSKI